jgi:SAM-dependent methyltransferase
MADLAAPDLLAPVLACMDGRLPANVALMQLASAAPDLEAIDGALREAQSRLAVSQQGLRRLQELQALRRLASNELRQVKDIAAVARRAHAAGQDWAQTFDEAARISPEASVALYSLGDPGLLEAQTDELVTCMAEWCLLEPRFRVLDFGCGIGRIAKAIAPHVAQVVGVDVSAEMVRLARERTVGQRSVSITQVPPDSFAFAEEAFDVVLAIDSFPYVVDSGLAQACLAELTRVLAPEGRLLIVNYSYRGDVGGDRAELRSFADGHGLQIERNGTADFSLWDGRAFLLCRR